MNGLFTWLLNRDISEFDPQTRPYTKAYAIAISCSIPAYVRFLKEVFVDDDDKIDNFEKHPKREIYMIKAKTLYSTYESWALDNHLIEKGKFKGITLKKHMLEFNAVSWDKQVKRFKEVRRYVVIDRDVLVTELAKFKFDMNEEEDTDILDFDE